MKNLWFHIGMPKAGSTAIQYYLSCSLENFEQRFLSFADVSKSVKSAAEMNAMLTEVSSRGVPPNRYSPVLIDTGTAKIISSENFSYFSAENLSGLQGSGVAVIREPAGWVTSMATQDLLFSISQNFSDDDKSFSFGLASPEEELVHLIKSYCDKYIRMLDNIDSWSKVINDFRLIPYSTDGRIFNAISEQFAAFDISCNKSIEVGQLRVSYDFRLAQIAFSIYLAARFKFKCSRTQSCMLTSIAIGLDKLIFSDYLSDISQSASEQIRESLGYAHERYAKLLLVNGKGTEIRPLQVQRFQVLEDTYSKMFIDSLISVKLGFSQVPGGFDADRYLSLNPEIDSNFDKSIRFDQAVNHYRRIGFKESRPVVNKYPS